METVVTESLLSRTLIRGSVLAGLGIALILAISLEWPGFWTIPLFLAGLGLIAWGLVPYRQLTKLQLNPHKLEITDGKLRYIRPKERTLVIPLSEIESVEHVETKRIYGLKIRTKKGERFMPYFPESVTVELHRAIG